jgi:hypothetical protein
MLNLFAKYVCLTILLLLVAGCATAKPFEYSDPSQNKKGNGLMSGEKGEFIIYQK